MNEKEKLKSSIVAKLAEEGCVDLSDAEIERCLSGTVWGARLVEYAKKLAAEGAITKDAVDRAAEDRTT